MRALLLLAILPILATAALADVAVPPEAKSRVEADPEGAAPEARSAAPVPAGESCATRKTKAGPERYCVSSVLPAQLGNTYGPANLFDARKDTAWVPDNRPTSHGQYVVIAFDAPRTLTALRIDNGYQKNADIFSKNSRLRTIEVNFSDGETYSFDLDDADGTQVVTFDAPVTAAWVQVVIADTYPGWKYQDTGVSRILVEAE